MQRRLEQATYNDNKRTILLAQLELKHNEEKILVRVFIYRLCCTLWIQQSFSSMYTLTNSNYSSKYESNVIQSLFAQSNIKRLSSIEEDPFAVSSSKRKLIENVSSCSVAASYIATFKW